MTLAEEKQLVKKARSDPEAFGVLFDHYYPKIFGYVHKRVLDFEAAKDITSEVFFKSYTHLWKFRWQGISISSWFYRIATNEINAYFRKKRYRPQSLQKLIDEYGFNPLDPQTTEEEKKAAERQLQQHQDFLTIHSKLKYLPLKYQEVISLKNFEGMRIREIAEILHKKEGTVKSLLSRGLEKLRHLL
ncbi:MAG: RNA polymerase sigma factor [bacterium]